LKIYEKVLGRPFKYLKVKFETQLNVIKDEKDKKEKDLIARGFKFDEQLGVWCRDSPEYRRFK
jgi:hypothetical protein